ncbi:hypothetical protein M409DRAFT_55240 [Zasmidium cellare ATCC 36951]|uniref:Sulfotransferase domain-containing protein n=1 Tax=Zasmidium cellare ATCC 36951 TaxID=1080233 RepID=A0A6A6CI49_ZASCE|nr:uncharacterized protein M409DRAFT_55240 [Zasmidium cellare ATCC 36951]KAF2165860.1 hypothetical protein M409DRAFT_55240 [Zasmidium cellare ATCC 36951]
MAPNPTQRIYIFDQPRTCSMLLQRLLSQHPQLGHVFHPFSASAMYGKDRIHLLLRSRDPSTDAHQDKLANDAGMNGLTYASSESDLKSKVEAIEREGKIVCLKDHLICLMRQDLLVSRGESWSGEDNPVRRFSEEFLLSIRHPIFLIRHPGLMIRCFWESQQDIFKLRSDDDMFVALTTLRWTSILHDWYRNHGIDPIVIDAYDIVYNTTKVMETVCAAVGIDPEGVKYEWPAQDRVDWSEGRMAKTFLWKLQCSTGVQREDGSAGRDEFDLESQTERWEAEWGHEVSLQLRHRVEEELPIYERMKSRALRF